MPKIKPVPPALFNAVCESVAEVGPPLVHRIFLDDLVSLARSLSKRVEIRVLQPKRKKVSR